MRLKLGLVLFGDVDDPPELICHAVGLDVTRWLCHSVGGDTQYNSEQEEAKVPVKFHTGSFLNALISCASNGALQCILSAHLERTAGIVTPVERSVNPPSSCLPSSDTLNMPLP